MFDMKFIFITERISTRCITRYSDCTLWKICKNWHCIYEKRSGQKIQGEINYLVCTDLISVVLPVNSANFLCTDAKIIGNRHLHVNS